MKNFASLSIIAVAAVINSVAAATVPGHIQLSFQNGTVVGILGNITSYGIFGDVVSAPLTSVYPLEVSADLTIEGTQNIAILGDVLGYTAGPYLGITTPATQTDLSASSGYGHLTGSPLTGDSATATDYTDDWSNQQAAESQVWIVDPATLKITPKWINSDGSTFSDFTVSWKPYGVARQAGTITFVTSPAAVPSLSFPVDLTFVAT